MSRRQRRVRAGVEIRRAETRKVVVICAARSWGGDLESTRVMRYWKVVGRRERRMVGGGILVGRWASCGIGEADPKVLEGDREGAVEARGW